MYKKEWEIESSPTMCHIERCCFYYFVRNSLVALLEALCAQMQIWVFDVWSLCWNRTGDLGTDSPALWPTKLVVYRLQWPQLWHSESVCSFMHLLTHARCAQCHEFFFNSCVFGLASPCTCLRYDKIDRSCTSHTFASDPLHCYEFGPPEFFSITFKFSIIYCTQLWKFPEGANFDLEKHAALEKNQNRRKSRANSRNLLEPVLRSRKEENLYGDWALSNTRRVLSKGSELLRSCWFKLVKKAWGLDFWSFAGIGPAATDSRRSEQLS